MKKRINFLSILTILVLFTSSCVDEFLSEEPTTGKTESSYLKATSLKNLVNSCYTFARGWYGKEAAFGLSEGGTDIWLQGYDNRQKGLINYSSITPASRITDLNENPCFDEYWEMFFAAINTCNTALYYIDENTELTNAEKIQYKGEISFLRAFYYWHLVETWGAVPIMKEMVTSVETDVIRNSEAEVYDFMISDVNTAIENLKTQTTKTGRVNLYAAKALKARLLLYLASEYAGGNYPGGASKAYTDAVAVADEIISAQNSSTMDFYANYSDCWKQTNEDGINNKEVIWYVEYDKVLANNVLPYRLNFEFVDGKKKPVKYSQMIVRDKDYGIGGNCSHLMFSGVWDKHSSIASGSSKVVGRTDSEAKKVINGVYVGSFFQPYSKGFCRYAPSGYLLDLYNENTDQRYHASFRDTYKIPTTLMSKKTNAAFTQPGATTSDTVIYLSKHAVLNADELSMMSRKHFIMGTRTDGVIKTIQFPMYTNVQGSKLTYGTSMAGNDICTGRVLFISLKKFDDYGTTSDGSAPLIRDLSPRDVFVFRLSEIYLIKAEAQLGAGIGDPLATINALRLVRAKAPSTNAIAGPVTIQTILDERAIELCGEQQRWFDLKRLGKLTSSYLVDKNLDASNNVQSYHRLRPIPQVQIDAVTNKGVFTQNPGY